MPLFKLTPRHERILSVMLGRRKHYHRSSFTVKNVSRTKQVCTYTMFPDMNFRRTEKKFLSRFRNECKKVCLLSKKEGINLNINAFIF